MLIDVLIFRYWQSDGSQPHLINIQFHKKMSIVEVGFYLDYKLDESYTPKKLSVRAGTTFHDLEEVHLLELEEPNGWIYLPIGKIANHGGQKVLRTHFLQVSSKLSQLISVTLSPLLTLP